MLERSVRKLHALISADPSRDTEARLLLRYQADHLIPKCDEAFTTVLADTQFAALGAILVATLARFARMRGMLSDRLKREAGVLAKSRDGIVVKTDALIEEEKPGEAAAMSRTPEDRTSKILLGQDSARSKITKPGSQSVRTKGKPVKKLSSQQGKKASTISDIFGDLI
ncbi:MAG: hypothetical protein M1814_002834 [Vezdaea aestivalis]|nr:MAG: hypothetical protein M1814_002834 [Vezdaea aestivalis]